MFKEIRLMKNRFIHRSVVIALALSFGLMVAVLPIGTGAQDRLKTMPGYEQYQKMSREIPGAVKAGTLSVKWQEGGKAFEYQKDGKTFPLRHRYAKCHRSAAKHWWRSNQPGGRGGRGGRGGPERGRQFDSATSPDGKLKAFYRDRNLWLSDASGANEIAITTDGSEKDRIKYGTASWVYGEELDQTTAMWWSPDSKKIAFYRFDESQVPDYFLQLDQTKLAKQDGHRAYPKAGVPNPVVDLFVYDVETKKTSEARCSRWQAVR